MKDNYLGIQCVIPPSLEEELPELLAQWPVLGTEIGAEQQKGIPITIYLAGQDEDCADDLSRLLEGRGAWSIERRCVEADDWLAAFRASLQPFEVGESWWIDPHPHQPTAAPAGRQRLTLEPRMAFGAGTHESTQGILKILEKVEVADRRVLDVGTGSGILALAAESLKAEWVVGCDIDPMAVWVAADCAVQQEWESGVSLVVGSVDCLAKAEFDIVLCNMVSSNFLPLASDLRRLLADTGVAVFAGLLASEAESVSLVLENKGFAVTSRFFDGEWASLTAVAGKAP